MRNRIDVRLVSNKKDYFKWTSKASYMSQKIFDDGLVAISKSRVILKLNKLAYVGMCILDLSKVLIYEFHYDYIQNKYGDKSRLWFTDTDSLMYEIKTEDVYGDFGKDKEMFDKCWAIIKNPEMLKFVPDHLQTKKICKNAVKKLPFVIMYVLDRCKTQEMYDKVLLGNGGTLRFVPDCYKNKRRSYKALIIIFMH